jgi:hypothetical protein
MASGFVSLRQLMYARSRFTLSGDRAKQPISSPKGEKGSCRSPTRPQQTFRRTASGTFSAVREGLVERRAE